MAKYAAHAGIFHTPAKVTQPVLSRALSRIHLFEKIDLLKEHQVIWISSPAGSGKTTLISTYLEDRCIPCLWYQVDMGDDDPATFFHYFGRATLCAAPRIRKAFPAFTPEYLLGLPAFTMRFFEDVCNHLFSHSSKKKRIGSEEFVMVFDNCQEVPDSSAFHTVLLTGLTRVPTQITIILISRIPPPPTYARLQANNQIGMLGWDDLRLSQEEVNSIVCLQTGNALEAKTIEDMYSATGGWAAGLTLMLGAARREGFQEILPSGSTPEEIMQYFGSELFDRLDKPTKDFLLKTSLLPRMTVQMSQDLTGNQNANRILSNLHRNNFFIHKRLQEEPCYEYHPLFRDFLLHAIQENVGGEEFVMVSRLAASLLEKSGQVEAAVDLLKGISCWETMTPLIISHAPQLVEQGRYRSLHEWFSSVPDDAMEESPWLKYWKATSLLPFEPFTAKQLLEQAYSRFVSDKELTGILLSVTGIIQAIHLQFSDHVQYDPWIPVVEDLLKKTKEFPSKEIEARLVEGMVTMLVLRRPDHSDIEQWIARANLFIDQPIPITLKARLIFAPLFYYFYKWDTTRMDLVHEMLKSVKKSKNIPPLAALIVYFGEVYYHMMVANHQECLETADKALFLARESGVHVMDNAFLGEAATSCLNENDLHKAKEYLDALSNNLEYFSLRDKLVYHRVKAREALIKKDYDQALSHACKTLGFSKQQGSWIGITVGNFIMGQSLHFLRKHTEEDKYLEESFIFPQLIEDPALTFFIILQKATCAFDRGDDISGYRYLKEAFSIGKDYKNLGTAVDIPTETVKLCVHAIEAGIEPEYARWLIRMRRFTLDPPPYHLEGWPWLVKISTLGRFAISIDDKALTFPKRAQNKPLEVLKMIISGGGANVSETHVADTLWPDAEGDTAMQSLATNLHRLRKLLGHHDAVLLQNGILSLDRSLCWIDARAFEYSLSRADALWEKARSERDLDEACRLFCSSIELYHGEFLPDDQWIPDVLAMREYLHMKFLKALSRAGEHMVKAGQYDKARQAIERGLDIDGCAENLYRLLMLCLQRQGHKAEALTVYERCRKTLHAELGTAPSSETEAMARALRA
ncbi:MAG TPA: BTAD domain-containing putative transcriptional regulator [Syntrophorhabdus sp.]|nr:BTAD domain-containing putative transcriptional regulator [Syntrophorhabdus sp.]